MQKHVIVCGYGRVGTILSRRLAASGCEVVVIDSSPTRVALAEEAGFATIEGDAADEDVLRDAGIDEASQLASVLPSDSANVFVTLTATGLRPDLAVIARAENPSSESKLRRSGASQVVLPAAIGADRIANIIARPSAESMLRNSTRTGIELGEDLDRLGLRLEELELHQPSPLIGRAVREIEVGGQPRLPDRRTDSRQRRRRPQPGGVDAPR